MQGRYPTGMYVVQSESVNLDQQRELIEWFKTTRIPDLIMTGWVDNGSLFEAIGASSGFYSGGLLALHETDRWDMEDMLEEIPNRYEIEWEREQRTDPNLRSLDARLFRRCGPPFRPEISGFTTPKSGVAPVYGLIAVFGTYRMIERSQSIGHRGIDAGENEYNVWYCRSYVPQVIQSGPFHTAYRYACADRDGDGRRQFMTLYETDADDPLAATKKFFDEWESAEQRNDIVQEHGYTVYRPVS